MKSEIGPIGVGKGETKEKGRLLQIGRWQVWNWQMIDGYIIDRY